MTDLELTKRCADGHFLRTERNVDNGLMVSRDGNRAYYFTQDGAYDPLHDDAQCFALLKKKRIAVQVFDGGWENADLNRAVVECVAQMQASK